MLVYLSAVCCVLVAQAFSQSMNKYELDKRLYYLNMPISRYLMEGDGLSENRRRINDELRNKRFDDLNEFMSMEDPSGKRSSLKRLAILSARGFGK